MLGDDLGADCVDGGAVEGADASGQLIENNADGKNVGAMVLCVALDLFGREIGGCADQPGGAGNLSGKAGDAEVAEFDLPIVGDKDVGGLDVAVYHARFVGAAKGAGKVASPNAGAGERHGTFFRQDHIESFARDVFGDEIGGAVLIGAEIVDGNDVGMGKAAEYLRFAKELSLEFGGAESRGQGL